MCCVTNAYKTQWFITASITLLLTELQADCGSTDPSWLGEVALLQAEVRLAIGTHCIWLSVCSKCLSSTCDQGSSHNPWREHKSQPKHTAHLKLRMIPPWLTLHWPKRVMWPKSVGEELTSAPGRGIGCMICQLSQWDCQNSPPLTIRRQTFEYNANCYKIRLPNLLEALSHEINKNNVREQFRSHTDTSLWHHLLSIEEKSNIDHDTITNSQENCLNIRERPLGKLIYTFA